MNTSGLGSQLIAELRRRGLYGTIFDYCDYQKLHKAADPTELRQVLQSMGFDIDTSAPISIIADDLVTQQSQRLHKDSSKVIFWTCWELVQSIVGIWVISITMLMVTVEFVLYQIPAFARILMRWFCRHCHCRRRPPSAD